MLRRTALSDWKAPGVAGRDADPLSDSAEMSLGGRCADLKADCPPGPSICGMDVGETKECGRGTLEGDVEESLRLPGELCVANEGQQVEGSGDEAEGDGAVMEPTPEAGEAEESVVALLETEVVEDEEVPV